MVRTLILAFLILVGVPPGLAGADEAPRFVIYYNADATPADALVGLPYSHVILSFLTTETDVDGKIRLVVPDKIRPALATVKALRTSGKKVLISFGGGDMTAGQYLPLVGRTEQLADLLARFVHDHGLDGVDIDFEISAALHAKPVNGSFDGKQFLIRLTQQLRAALDRTLPDRETLITHAPETPYLNRAWHGGPYLEILAAAGDDIDWITVQYYNNPGFNDPLDATTGHLKESTYAELTGGAGGIAWPPHKTLVGKPVYIRDANNGYLPPEQLLEKVVRPLVEKYGGQFGGLTGWQFSTHTADHQFWNEEMAAGLKPARN